MQDPNSDLEDMTERITNRTEFIHFCEDLIRNLRTTPDEWSNSTLEDYLAALTAFLRSADGYYGNMSIDVDANKPSWRLFADMLLAARVYE